MYHFCIADDHPLYRDALTVLLQQHWPDCQVQQAANLAGLLQLLQSTAEPDLVMLDVNMPGSTGLAGLQALKQHSPQLAIVMLSAEDDKQTILQAMALGAVGFISKAAARQELIAALEHILQGNVYLPAQRFRHAASSATTPLNAEHTLPAQTKSGNAIPEKLASLSKQQQRVLRLLLTGLSNKQIADSLYIAETTVKAHVSAIYDKLAVSNRAQLLSQAAQWSTTEQKL